MDRSLRSFAATLAVAVAIVAAGGVPALSGATFARASQNPANALATLSVQPPPSLGAVGGSGGAVTLSWSASPTTAGAGHLLSYLVLRGPAGGPYAQIGATGSLTYDDTPASDGTYAYIVRTQVSGGGAFQSAGSPAATALSDRVPPSAATNLTSTQGAKAGIATINLAWTAATDALSGVQGYEVRWSNIVTTASCPAADPGSYPNAATVGAVTSATLPLSGTLQSGKKYCAYLVTIDGVGNPSAASATTGPTTAR